MSNTSHTASLIIYRNTKSSYFGVFGLNIQLHQLWQELILSIQQLFLWIIYRFKTKHIQNSTASHSLCLNQLWQELILSIQQLFLWIYVGLQPNSQNEEYSKNTHFYEITYRFKTKNSKNKHIHENTHPQWLVLDLVPMACLRSGAYGLS